MRAWLFPGQEVTVELAAVGGDVEARIEDAVKNVLLPKLEAKPEQVVTGADRRVGRREPHPRAGRSPGARWRLRLAPAEAVLAAAPRRARRPVRWCAHRTGVTLRRSAGPAVRYVGDVTTTGGAALPLRTASWSYATPARASSASRSPAREPTARSPCAAGRHRGTVYAAVVERVCGRRLCRFARSRRVGG